MPHNGKDDLTPLSVTVVGGGVTGLSAAHELMERGFKVQVIERREHPYEAGACEIGGMARTQWSRFPAEEFATRAIPRGTRKARPPLGLAKAAAEAEEKEAPKSSGVGPEADVSTIPFDLHSSDCGEIAKARLERLSKRLREYIERYVARDDDDRPCGPDETRAEVIYIEGYHYNRRRTAWDTESGADRDEPANLSRDRAAEVRAILASQLAKPLPIALWGNHRVLSPNGEQRDCQYLDYLSLRPVDLKDVLSVKGTLSPREQAIARVRVAEVSLPGEHGYRFFPGFYQHIFDVMRRIPILGLRSRDLEDLERERAAYSYREALKQAGVKGLDPLRQPVISASAAAVQATAQGTYVRDGRTVHDNLIAVELHSVAREGDTAPVALSRRRATSVREILELVRAFQEEMQLEAGDLARYQLKLIQYMTSSTARRHGEYEQVSWSDFIGIDKFSDAFREALKIWPQALVGMRSDEIDARTAGNITVQLLLDQLRDSGVVDATLNASTSEAWLEPWRRYLKSEGVSFECAELKELRWNDREGISFGFTGGLRQPEPTNYYLLALPVEVVYDLAVRLRGAMSPQALEKWFTGSDLSRVVQFMDEQNWDPLQKEDPNPAGPLRHFSGVQFYLEHDVRLVRGHIYYASSPWGLTSISQVQFRREAPGVRDDYRGIISLDIGNWYSPGQYEGKPGWECSPREIASEVWQQVDAGARGRSRSLAEPIWYHIDDEIKFGSQAWEHDEGAPARPHGVVRNESPYLLNLPRAWVRRPGGPEEDVGRYSMLFDGAPGDVRAIVLAGPFMRTRTRLVTMEAANESARHAVNRILEHAAEVTSAGRIGALCETWSPEDREPMDLKLLKDLDEKLCARKLPHLFDILQLEGALSGCEGDASLARGCPLRLEEMVDVVLNSGNPALRLLQTFGFGVDIVAVLKAAFGRGE